MVLLFWNSRGADDVAVRRAVTSVAHGQRKVKVNVASMSQVASFGTITKGVQVYGTPTVLVIGKSGQVVVITGFTTAFAIDQAVSEARRS